MAEGERRQGWLKEYLPAVIAAILTLFATLFVTHLSTQAGQRVALREDRRDSYIDLLASAESCQVVPTSVLDTRYAVSKTAAEILDRPGPLSADDVNTLVTANKMAQESNDENSCHRRMSNAYAVVRLLVTDTRVLSSAKALYKSSFTINDAILGGRLQRNGQRVHQNSTTELAKTLAEGRRPARLTHQRPPRRHRMPHRLPRPVDTAELDLRAAEFTQKAQARFTTDFNRFVQLAGSETRATDGLWSSKTFFMALALLLAVGGAALTLWFSLRAKHRGPASPNSARSWHGVMRCCLHLGRRTPKGSPRDRREIRRRWCSSIRRASRVG